MAVRTLRTFPLLALLAGCAAPAPGVDPFALVAEADAAYRRGDWAQAETRYRALTETVPQDAYAFFRLGNTLVRQQRFDEALAAYREALVREPRLGKAYANMGTVHLLKARYALEEALRHLPADSAAAAKARRRLEALQRLSGVRLGRAGRAGPRD